MDNKWLSKAGIFFGLLLVLLVVINGKVSKEINEDVISVKNVATVVSSVVKPPPPKEVEAQALPTDISAKTEELIIPAQAANVPAPPQEDKKIIYELPLDDVILVQ